MGARIAGSAWQSLLPGLFTGAVFFLPFSVNAATGLFLATGILWLALTVWTGSLVIRRTALDLPLSGVVALSALSITQAPNGFESAYNWSWLFARYVLVYFLAVHVIQPERHARRIFAALLLAAVLVGFHGIYQYMTGVDTSAERWVDSKHFPWLKTRAFSTLGNPNILAGFLVMCIGIAVAFVLEAKKKTERMAAALTIPVMLVCIAVTFSRGAWVALGLMGMAAAALRGRRAKILCLVALIVAVATISFVQGDAMARLRSIGNPSDSSSYLRFLLLRDISVLKKVAAELEANQRFLADVIENNGALIYAKDQAGRYQLVNRKWEQETGLCREVAIGKTDVELFSPEIGAAFRENDLRIMACGCVQEIEEVLESEQGARYFISIKFPLRDANGDVSGICGVSTDITQRKQTEAELAKLNQKLEAIGITDALTGISNRRHFDEVLSQEYARHSRTGADLSLILLDIDHFKAYNDYYGHLQGDECLRRIGRILTQWTKRPADLAARYGGEEFACILPDTDLSGAVAVAEHIRQAIVQAAIPHEKSLIDRWVTASFGVASLHCSGHQSVEALVGHADAMLYQAKAAGRNRVESVRLTEQIEE